MGNLSHSYSCFMTDTTAPALLAPTLEDLQHCGADELLNLPTPAVAYHEMQNRLHVATEAALAADDQSKAAALRLLVQICSMMLMPDEPSTPFKPMLVMSTGRTMIPEDLMLADVDLLADLAPILKHPLLRARVADLVWFKVRGKGVKFAHMAVEAYRQPSIEGVEWDIEALTCCQRAIQVAASTGKGGGAVIGEIARELLVSFWRAVDADEQQAALRYLRPLQAEGLATGEAKRIAAALEEIARKLLREGDPFGAQHFADRAQFWFGRARDESGRAVAQLLVAQSWEAQADKDGSGITRHHCYAKAIDAYQRVSARYRAQHGAGDAIAQLRAKLPAAGLDMLAQMRMFSHSIDISDVVAEAVGKVQGLPPTEALFAFGQIAPLPRLDALREEASIPLSGIGAIFSTASVDEDGRVIAQQDGVDDAESRERRLAAEMVVACARHADISARAMIDPALDVIRQQFHWAPQDFFEIAKLSALVPSDRADLVAKGLYAGYCRDFVPALHILLPQFEHMVREVLKDSGAITTSRQDGIEMELGLSSLVELPEMKQRFGEELTFMIRSLMCKPIGPNLRNNIAHGLAGANLCYSGYGVYAWWLILALVLQGYRIMHRAEEANNLDSEQEA